MAVCTTTTTNMGGEYSAVPVHEAGPSSPRTTPDQPYAKDELDLPQPKWQQQAAQFGFQDRPVPPQSLAASLLDVVTRCKTYILLGVCTLLAFAVLFDRHPALAPATSWNAPVSAYVKNGRPMEDDMVLITKVGSATVHKRLMIHLAEQPLSSMYTPNRLYVSDWPVTLGPIHFYDALGNVTPTVAGMSEFRTLRGELKALMESNQDLDDMSQKDGGWKLDKYKFLPMMAEAYRQFPDAKWYVMVEADTFLFWNQLVKWLSTLNENKQLLIGHPSFCDYDGKSVMFSHGGSGIVMSKALMAASFGQDDEYEHNHDDLIEKSAFGDALLTKSFYDAPKVHITELAEEGGEKFNSDPPRVLKFRRDVWCTPIMSFHHVTPSDTAHLYDFQRRIEPLLAGRDDLIRWADIWDEFMPQFLRKALGEVSAWEADPASVHLKSPNAEPGEVGVVAWQAIEEWDSETTDTHTASAEECQTVCRSHADCLLWAWEREPDSDRDRPRGLCRWTAEFLRIGVTKPDKRDLTTGWMAKRIAHWRAQFGCSGRTGLNAVFPPPPPQ